MQRIQGQEGKDREEDLNLATLWISHYVLECTNIRIQTVKHCKPPKRKYRQMSCVRREIPKRSHFKEAAGFKSV